MVKIKIFILCFICTCESVYSQSYTLEQVWETVLKKDFDIQIQKNNQQIINNQNNIGAKGMLPTLSIDLMPDLTLNNARQEFLTGQINEATGAQNRTFHTGAQLNWVLFDGFQMFAKSKRFDLMDEQAALSYRAQVELRLYQVALHFYTLLAYQERQKVYEEAVELANMRYDLIRVQHEKGRVTQLDVLQAKLDLAADSAQLLQLYQQVEGVKIQLANFLQEKDFVALNVSGGFDVKEELDYTTLASKFPTQNVNLLLAKSEIAIREQQKKEVVGQFYPQLSFFSNYNFNSAQNEVGFLIANRVYGPTFGLTLRWNVLDGLSRMQNLKNARIDEDNARIMEEKQLNDITAELKTAYNDFSWANKTLKLEQNNQLAHQEIVTITTARLQLGAINPIQLRDVQMRMLEAKHRMIEAKLQTVIAQLNISLLTGDFSNYSNPS